MIRPTQNIPLPNRFICYLKNSQICCHLFMIPSVIVALHSIIGSEIFGEIWFALSSLKYPTWIWECTWNYLRTWSLDLCALEPSCHILQHASLEIIATDLLCFLRWVREAQRTLWGLPSDLGFLSFGDCTIGVWDNTILLIFQIRRTINSRTTYIRKDQLHQKICIK